MRWMPSTRISLTTKGSNAHAGPVSTSRSAARSAFFTDGSLTREQAVEVVVDGERHQEEEQREAQALAQFHRSLRNRAALENLDDIIEQVSPIQYGNRKQVEHTQADADQREKCDVGADPELRRLTRVIGDRHRSTQVLPGDLADDHLAEHLQAEHRRFPSPRERHSERGGRRVAHGRYEALHRFGIDLRSRPDAADALAVLLHRLRSQPNFNLLAAAHDAEPHDFAGPAPDRLYDIFPDLDLPAIDGNYAVSRAQSSRLGYAPRDDLADDRRDIGPVEPQPQTREGIAVEAFEVETRQIQGAPGEPLLGVDHLEPRRLLFHRELQQPPAHLLPARHRLLIYFQDRFAPLKAARLRDGSGIRGADNRLRLLHAAYEKRPVEHDGEQKIRRRARSDDRDAPPDALAVECPVHLFGRDRPFVLVEHFHVAAQRQRGDHPLGLVPAASDPPQRPAEADREAQYLHPEQARDQIVAELVKHDQHAQRDDESQDGDGEIHAACAFSRVTLSFARTRVPAPRSRMSSSVARGPAGRPARASSMSVVISRNGNRPSRNADTATSLAALSVAGAAPPLLSAA